MAGTHGDLYREIGGLVLAANAGAPFDLDLAAEELSRRYAELGVSPDVMARAIARSLVAVGVSVARLERAGVPRTDAAAMKFGEASGADARSLEVDGTRERSAAALFPSGVRLALLS